MFYLLGIIVAVLLVSGQALWKVGVTKAHLELSTHFLLSTKVFGFIFSPYILGGVVIYGAATLMYFGLLTKYQYSAIQGLVVPVSLISTFLLARIFFNERLSILNYVGLLILIVGILLATRR